jgi:two-component system, OmpR family, alkaline phosphatase synthesis response regulator PhoP
MPTILVIDDEMSIQKLVEAYLLAEGYTVHIAGDGRAGWQMFREVQPDLVILDIMLPGIDGLDLLRQIRAESDVYVLMLTAKSEEPDRVIGLTLGADDYLTKPFSPRELVARVKAILKRDRGRTDSASPDMCFAHVRIDEQRHAVWREGEAVDLTALEFKLLVTLARHAGLVLSRGQLLEQVWGYDFYGDERVVDVHIGRIRQKLEVDPANPQFVLTVRGVGYKFDDDPCA